MPRLSWRAAQGWGLIIGKFLLPDKGRPKDVENALEVQFEASRTEHIQKAVHWTLTHWYLQGVRKIRIAGLGTAQPQPSYHDVQGRLRIRFEKVLQMRQAEIGRLMGLDLAPYVKRPIGVALDGVRSTSISQTVLDNFYFAGNPTNTKLAFIQMLVDYGTVAIGAFPGQHSEIGFGVDTFIIPPWELRPLSAGITGPHEKGGVTWTRWVPLDWLKEHFGKLLSIPRDEKLMDIRESSPGSLLQTQTAPRGLTSPSGGDATVAFDRAGKPGTSAHPKAEKKQKFVELRQTWVEAEPQTYSRWLVTLGRKLAHDSGELDELRPSPLHPCWYRRVGSFWGRGFVDSKISLNQSLEAMVSNLIQNIQEADSSRILAIPVNSGINFHRMRIIRRNKFMAYMPEFGVKGHEPRFLSPPNIGDTAGRAIAMIGQMLDDDAAQGPMSRGDAPGRTDSAKAILAIQQAQNAQLSATAADIETCYGGYYKAALEVIRDSLHVDRELHFTRLDESIVGLKFDEKTRTVKLADNPLPKSVLSMNIGVRSALPQDKTALQAGLDHQLELGLITPVQYKIAAEKYDLGLPTVNRAAYEHYVTAWLANVIMFGDGEKPGAWEGKPDFEDHAIGYSVVTEFMATAVFRLAHDDVHQAFRDRKDYHMENMGRPPEQLVASVFGEVGLPPDEVQRALGVSSESPAPGLGGAPGVQ
ncbi:hypothetical protein LCGC14_0564990 [marine sediment metagenome]|uniref:Uncharacterized protein n=1 Tax=marine sediment metagenome TaxID=412755 RepID=A0A0F9U7B5_9ZZZZ